MQQLFVGLHIHCNEWSTHAEHLALKLYLHFASQHKTDYR